MVLGRHGQRTRCQSAQGGSNIPIAMFLMKNLMKLMKNLMKLMKNLMKLMKILMELMKLIELKQWIEYPAGWAYTWRG